MQELIQLDKYPVSEVLDILLQDHTTGKNIIWATKSYQEYGERYTDTRQIEKEAILEKPELIRPRVAKSLQSQAERTKAKAEVFTPSWICNKMINAINEEWFGRKNVFNTESENSWVTNKEKIQFPQMIKPEDYINQIWLEITCGEAPFLVSRYDAASGRVIKIQDRIGILDRKLRVADETTINFKAWLTMVRNAFKSIYGYEYQGDNLLIARINLLNTFVDAWKAKWQDKPIPLNTLKNIALIISWNLWQMDGLNCCIPLGKPEQIVEQLSLFEDEKAPLCKIMNWNSNKNGVSVLFIETKNNKKEAKVRNTDMKKDKKGHVKFDIAIGNPPYQEVTEADSTRMPPVYNLFMDEAYKSADIVELITPARFLFNAGWTPKEWNEKMLSDPHFKVLEYFQTSEEVFPKASIMGGIAISFRNSLQDYGAIEVFTSHQHLNSIHKKVSAFKEKPLSSVAFPALSYKLSEKMKTENPHLINRLRTNAFEVLEDIFYSEKPDNNVPFAMLLGLLNRKRTKRYIREDYLKVPANYEFYKVCISKADGAAGTIGKPIPARIMGIPEILKPKEGHTQSFISIGQFKTQLEAENLLIYLKTKFARSQLGILKITQDNPPEKWKYVPLQDFSSKSDIDWSKSSPEIDQQLYRKYGLSPEEVEFIESHVKEMS